MPSRISCLVLAYLPGTKPILWIIPLLYDTKKGSGGFWGFGSILFSGKPSPKSVWSESSLLRGKLWACLGSHGFCLSSFFIKFRWIPSGKLSHPPWTQPAHLHQTCALCSQGWNLLKWAQPIFWRDRFVFHGRQSTCRNFSFWSLH